MVIIKGRWDAYNHCFYIPKPNIDFDKLSIVSFRMGDGNEVFITYKPLY